MTNKKRNYSSIYPGAQKRVRNFNFVFFLLFSLTVIFFFLTIYSVLRQNYINSNLPISKFLTFDFIDSKTAYSILFSLIGLLLVRHHFILGFNPKIIYQGKKTKIAEHPELDAGNIIWQVKIRNVGLGTAVFIDYAFRVCVSSIDEGKEYDLDFYAATQNLQECGFVLERDYCLTNITNGFAIPSKEELIVFEVKLPVGYNLKQLDVRMIFEGYLGGRYEKDVYLIPRLGIFSKENNKTNDLAEGL